MTLIVHAPLDGWCLPLADVPDAVFRDALLGEGLAIDPTTNVVAAPFNGVVTNVADSAHSVTVTADDGSSVLIHVGIDTVALAGQGFDVHVEEGRRVATGEKLLTFDMDAIARNAPSLVTPVILMARDGALLGRLRDAGPVAAGDVLFDVTVADAASPAPEAVEGDVLTAEVRVTLPHGLHARPAATIAAALRELDAVVRCRNAAGATASLASPVAMLALGLRAGDRVHVEAAGADRAAALDEAVASLGAPVSSARVAGDAVAAVRAPRPGDVLHGQCAVGGLAAGTATPLGGEQVPVRHESRGAADERVALDGALDAVRRFLADLGETGAARDIAAAHAAFLDDPGLVADVERRIDGGQSAPEAWCGAIGQAAAGLDRLDDEYLRARAADLRDVGRRVQRVLAGEDAANDAALAAGSIVLADDILPTQLLEMDRARLAGICLARGGASSHAAILAASFDIPMIVAAGTAVTAIEHGTELLLDADAATLTLAPGRDAVGRFRARMDAERAQRDAELAAAHEPCRSRDGTAVTVLANLASVNDAREAVARGADGCGLLRTEFLYMGRATAPGRDEQAAVLQSIADELGERPFVVRALDAGGDKPLAFVAHAAEENPALGVRGIRLLLGEPALLAGQFDALLAIRPRGALRVMLPMISSVDEIRRARDVLEGARARARGDARIELGVMVETPAAALTVDRLAPYVDFFSIGTNDLTQYTLAMDRGAPALAAALDALHPAVLRLVAAVARAADAAGRPVSVCGNAAADPVVAAVLVGLGIRQLSVVPAAVPRLKATIREWSLGDCRALATRALDYDSAEVVRAAVREFLAGAAERAVDTAKAAT